MGLRVRQREARGGFGAKTSFVTQFQVCHTKQRWAVVMGGGGCGLMARRWRGGCKFANTRPEGGLGQNPKLSICSSVSCMPCKTGVAGDAGWRWVWVKGTEVTGGLCIQQCQAGGWGLGQKPETEL